jgi:nucleoside-diphosphate-sugar epimerase
MAKVLITGADGFTGRYLASALLERRHHVIGLSRAAGLIENGVEIHACDLTDVASLQDIIATCRADWVVHLAAISFVAHADVTELYQANIVGTRNLLDLLSRADAAPSRILIASSASVYGNRREGILTEDMPSQPANDYGISKQAVEALARIYGGRLPIVVTRPFNYTGRGQSQQFLLPKIVEHFRQRAPSIRLGNIDVARDFSDVRTLVDCYIRLLDCDKAFGGTFNICSGKAHLLRDVIAIVEQQTGHHIELEIDPNLVRRDEVKTLAGSKVALEQVIGPVDAIPIDETIAWMLADA